MEQLYRVIILPEHIEVTALPGASLLEVLRQHLPFDAPCGGNGLCGKCAVEVAGPEGVEQVLACQTKVNSNMTVYLGSHPPEGQPPLSSPSVTIPNATAAIKKQPFIAQKKPSLALAFDLGTTTLACCLLHLQTGATLSQAEAPNPQRSYGADVTARLQYALEHGGACLREPLVAAMNQLLTQVCQDAGVSTEQIIRATVVGNSAMTTLLLDASPLSLIRPPYQPVSTKAVTLPAVTLGLALAKDVILHILPLIGGFVGGDTTGCLLATDFDALPGSNLLMDVGTNGELVVGVGDKRVACSTAAGPAFEGTLLHSGMRAGSGAITSVKLVDGDLHFTVIGDTRPAGLCGSGLVSLTACLLESGVILPNGSFANESPLSHRLIPYNEQRALLLCPGECSATGRDILYTQKDVRSLQLAKAAILAGAETLLDQLTVPAHSLNRLYLAGAFGSELDISAAMAIGLLPSIPEIRVQVLGNAALDGAKIAALNPDAISRATALAHGTKHLSLSTCQDFQERFYEAMPFPAPVKEVQP